MFPFSGDPPFRRGRRAWVLATILLATTVAPVLAQAQACGGNSTVDALGAQAASSARAFLAQLQTAVRSNDKEQIERMVSYPLLVLRSGKRIHIRRQTVFLADYDRIFTPAVRHSILRQKPKCLFGNSSGAMIGDGQVWFREQNPGGWKIVTINEPTPEQ